MDEVFPDICKSCFPKLTGSLFLHECTCKKTVGQVSLDLLSKGDQKQSVLDTSNEMLKGYIDSLIQCALSGEEKHGKNFPFYVCVQSRRERLLTNVIRNQFYTRQTRPTPQYDLSLYWYDPTVQRLEFVWCIPDKETTEYLGIFGSQDPKQSELVKFCKAFIANKLV